MPAVAVCPVHGPVASQAFNFAPARHTTLHSLNESCPVPGCGRTARVMDGVFDFDSNGIATVISAPQWSIDALRAVQRDLSEAAGALRDEKHYDAARAYALLHRKLDDMETRLGGLGAELATQIRQTEKTTARARLWKIVAAIAATVGFLGSVQPAVDFSTEAVSNVIDWAVAMYEQGVEPQPQDFPLPPRGSKHPAAH